jgi:hypothetical protein
MHRIGIVSLLIITVLLTIAAFFMMGNATQNIQTKNNIAEKPPVQQNTNTPFTANFAIYTNGTKRDFTAPKYHNRSQDAYISAENSEKIIVNKKGTTWQEFFDSLPAPFMITSTCLTTGTGQNFCTSSTKTLAFYVNKTPNPHILLDEIQPNDSLVIIYGDKNAAKEVLGASIATPSSIFDE